MRSADPSEPKQRAVIIDQILVDKAQQMTQFRRIHASDRDRVAVAPAEMLKFSDGVGRVYGRS
mgnify:CR=1 FL=1